MPDSSLSLPVTPSELPTETKCRLPGVDGVAGSSEMGDSRPGDGWAVAWRACDCAIWLPAPAPDSSCVFAAVLS